MARAARIKNPLPQFLAAKQQQAGFVLHQACLRIASEAATMIPMETSTLVNSQTIDVQKSGTRWRARVGYTANYAAYVHEAPGTLLGTNTPRPKRDGKPSKGVVWGPGGEPGFLSKAVEATADDVARIIRRGLGAKRIGLTKE